LSETSDHSLLTEQEAADFLQPHMPSKSVKVWLAYDRQSDPIVPFVIVQGQPCYLESDLKNFVTRTLNTSARFVRLNNRLYPERRISQSRRKPSSHVPVAGGVSPHGIKRRRRDDIEFRLGADLEHLAVVGLDRRARSKQPVH
jgi:hypothetical protein